VLSKSEKYVKVERFISFSRQGAYIVISSSNCTYLLIPKDIKAELERMGFSFKKGGKNVGVEAELVRERELGNATPTPYVVKLVFTLRKLVGPPEAGEEVKTSE
jgi:hypothetical protein